MKKLCYLLTGIALVLVGIAPAYAQLKPAAQLMLTRMLTDTKYYMFDRVKTMCQEWPGCEKWVKERLAQDNSFLIEDAEVERWIGSWENNEAVWHYHFYVQTRENSHIQAQLPQPVRVVTLMGNMEIKGPSQC